MMMTWETEAVHSKQFFSRYPITPVRQKKKASVENYDIGDLRSDDSTDDDEAPRKKIPSWAQGVYTVMFCCSFVCGRAYNRGL